MTTKQHIPSEATDDRAQGPISPELERLLRELAREREPRLDEEIEKSLVARIDAYQRAVIKSVEALCANTLVNSRDIERLNRIVASLPETKTDNPDFRRILASIEHCGGDAALSKREKGVLTQLVYGKSNREISEALGISDKTVKNHLWKIYRKLGVGNRSQLFHKLIA
ncbi:MAG: helix-turn-helix transcriptional regulator [Candidatus Krumholzibacteria bacterium]|nr:helix-turn-helix transcriptional regulator [Candidatus Krumholzibacteria bacterium]